jgi:hypothetical protein
VVKKKVELVATWPKVILLRLLPPRGFSRLPADAAARVTRSAPLLPARAAFARDCPSAPSWNLPWDAPSTFPASTPSSLPVSLFRFRHVEGGCFGGLGLAESREGAVVVALGPRHSEQVLVAGGSIMWEARGGPDFWPSGQWAAPTVLQSAEVSNLPRPPFCMLPSDSHRSFKHLIGEHALVNQMLNADAQILMPMKVPSMFERREGAVGALLPGGECVIVAGGARFCPGDPMGLDPEPYASKTVEVYDIASNSWAYGPPMHFERYK